MTHMSETTLIPCPHCGPPHMIEACAECGWPPALDGKCMCFYPEHLPRAAFVRLVEVEEPIREEER